MKNIYRISLLITFAAFLGSSCSKEYLNTKPTNSIGAETMFKDVKNAKIALNGVFKCMTQQYSGFGQGYNGEGTIKYYIGNFGGNNYNLSGSGNVASMNQTYHDNNASTFILYPWYYYYRMISNINSILANIDGAEGSVEEKNDIKAQALTLRAYSYTMLSQLFHKRWMDGHQDEAKDGNGLILRLEPTFDPMPISSAKATFEQIYKDLDEAIGYFSSYSVKRSNNYSIDKNVAYAVYARAALARLDYGNALKYAKMAREGYPLMSVADYKAGFFTPTSEWIWSSYGGSTETLYYYSFAAYVAYNAGTSTVRNNPRCISRELYNQIPSSDIRKDLFLDPQKDKYSTTNGQSSKGTPLYNRAFKLYPDINERAKVAAWMQFKFSSEDGLGVGHLNHFRSSEMYLIEAEAEYKLGNEPNAKAALIKLLKDSGRNPSYTCTKTGTDLFNEIKLYRSVELWGEGFEFFDLKRWGDRISRKGYDKGGNWGSTYVVTVNPEQYNEWTNVLPLKETDYNDLAK